MNNILLDEISVSTILDITNEIPSCNRNKNDILFTNVFQRLADLRNKIMTENFPEYNNINLFKSIRNHFFISA